ncbi:hypothetical protein FRC08_005320 [Ceratobasidium sp. 394]|nr:hypothetical protein FRC08_005320 [Ceratobasidium sp. 394]
MSRLTHLELECRLDDPESDDEDDRGEWIVSNLLSRLENSPHLLSLSLDINYFNEPHNIGCDDLMEIFSELPLEAISLTGVQVDDWAYNAEHLKTVWLNVTSIHLPDQHGSPSVLECFAQLPRLQYLKINLYLEEVEYCLDDEASLCPLHTLESSDGDIAQEPEDLEFIGEFLLLLFPNLRQVVWPPAQKNASLEVAAQERFVGFLNQHITLKREVEELKAKLKARNA